MLSINYQLLYPDCRIVNMMKMLPWVKTLCGISILIVIGNSNYLHIYMYLRNYCPTYILICKLRTRKNCHYIIGLHFHLQYIYGIYIYNLYDDFSIKSADFWWEIVIINIVIYIRTHWVGEFELFLICNIQDMLTNISKYIYMQLNFNIWNADILNTMDICWSDF